MSQVFADTGCWIALLNPRDELHKRVQQVSATLGSPQIVTSEWVLMELLNSFAERGTELRSVVSRTGACLRSNPRVIVVPQTSASSSFLLMRQYGMEAALTYDRHFEQASFKALLR